MGEYLAWMTLTAGLIPDDQISDHLSKTMVSLAGTMRVGSFFNIVLLFNLGAGYGLTANVWLTQGYLIILIALVVSALFARSIVSESRWRHKTAYVPLIWAFPIWAVVAMWRGRYDERSATSGLLLCAPLSGMDDGHTKHSRGDRACDE